MRSYPSPRRQSRLCFRRGARIDHAAHDNDPVGHLGDILAYHDTVRYLKEWVTEQNKHTPTVLISVSDHETGGLALGRQLGDAYPEYAWYVASSPAWRLFAYLLGTQVPRRPLERETFDALARRADRCESRRLARVAEGGDVCQGIGHHGRHGGGAGRLVASSGGSVSLEPDSGGCGAAFSRCAVRGEADARRRSREGRRLGGRLLGIRV